MLRTQVDQLASWTWVDKLSISMSWLTNIMFKYVCQFVYLLFLSLSQPALLTLFIIYLLIYLFIYLTIYLFIHLFIYLSIHPSIHPSIQMGGGEKKVPGGHLGVNK